MISDIKLKRSISAFVAVLLVVGSVISLFRTSSIVTKAAENSDRIIVSMGDSYSSGEGIEPFFDENLPLREKINSQNWLSHRSQNAWSGMLSLPNGFGSIRMSENRANWKFVAMSGAVTANILDTSPIQKGDEKEKKYRFKEYRKNEIISENPELEINLLKDKVEIKPQIDVFKELDGKKADYVTLTLGGNDVDFAGVLTNVCLNSSYLNPNSLYNKLNDTITYQLPDVTASLISCYNSISEKAGEQAHIIVAGYPHLLDRNGKGAMVSIYEATLVNNAVTIFNRSIEETIKKCSGNGMKISYVSVEKAFDNHEAYSDKTQKTSMIQQQKTDGEKGEFINRLVFGAQSQELEDNATVSSYSFHPNYYGACAYARCVQKEINRIEGVPDKEQDEESVENGSKILVVDRDGNNYSNYHLIIKDAFSKKEVLKADIKDDKGYTIDLESGTYIVVVSDNAKNGSKSIFTKTITVLPNLRNKDKSIVISTDYSIENNIDYDSMLNEKLDNLIGNYGIASTDSYTINSNTTDNKNWTNREGLVSAKLSDLDGDGVNELVVVRLIGGELNPYSENIELQVYYYADGEVKSAGSIKFLTGDDFKQKQIDAFICKIGNKRYIMFESDFTILATDSSEMYYDLISYNNGKIHKDRSIYLGDSDYGARWIEKIWDGDIESEQDIYFKDLEHTTATGTYKDSEDPILDYFKDFGLPKTEDAFELSRHHKYLNVNGSEKLFELIHSRVQTDLYKYSSSLTDYTDLDHSKSTTSAEKVEEWKELYISHFKEQENKSTLDYASFHIVDVNEDGTPELVYTGFAAMGTHMVWVKDGAVQDQAVGYGEFKYISSKNQIYCQYVNHGMTNDNVYSFTDRDLEKTFSGQILPKENGFENPGWSVNGENVSESEYNSQLKNAFNFDSSKSLDYEDSINGSDLLSRIKDY